MKKLSSLILKTAAFCFAAVMVWSQSAEAADSNGLKIRIVNFKTCVEKSKCGQQEQASFEALKKQMETMLSEKEKVLNDMAEKFNDPDYLDSLSPEAETELKRKFRALSQEASTQQQQYYQALQQANFKVLDKLDEMLEEACATVAKKNGINLVLNEDGTYFYDKDLDISDQVVAVMDEIFAREAAKTKEAAKTDKK